MIDEMTSLMYHKSELLIKNIFPWLELE